MRRKPLGEIKIHIKQRINIKNKQRIQKPESRKQMIHLKIFCGSEQKFFKRRNKND